MSQSVAWYETVEGRLAVVLSLLIVVLAIVLIRPDQRSVDSPESSFTTQPTKHSPQLQPFTASEQQPLAPQEPPTDTPATDTKNDAPGSDQTPSPKSDPKPRKGRPHQDKPRSPRLPKRD